MLFYQLILTVLAPVFAVRLMRDPQDIRAQRLALAQPQKFSGNVIWVHAASNGEATAARPLIEALLAKPENFALVISCNTESGRALVQSWGLERTAAVMAPLDYRFVLKRFLSHWAPAALVIVENELWPNRIRALAKAGRPIFVISARISQRSARRWKTFGGFAAQLWGRVSFAWPQDAASANRLTGLGLRPENTGPPLNLKLLGAGEIADAEAAPDTAVFDRENTVLAASTHEGEERVVLQAFQQARTRNPHLQLILAPRHPKRAAQIEKLIENCGLTFRVRSRGEPPARNAPVYLADTLGEMPLWYMAAAQTFVGGSLVPKGGHTPVEPISYGSGVIHGPHLENFSEIYQNLREQNAAREVTSPDELAQAFTDISQAELAAMNARAKAVMAQLGAMPNIEDAAAQIVRSLNTPA